MDPFKEQEDPFVVVKYSTLKHLRDQQTELQRFRQENRQLKIQLARSNITGGGLPIQEKNITFDESEINPVVEVKQKKELPIASSSSRNVKQSNTSASDKKNVSVNSDMYEIKTQNERDQDDSQECGINVDQTLNDSNFVYFYLGDAHNILQQSN
jgi:hypothetical protein